MATTVTYKGATLTTVDNNTRTLKTAGSYLEDDITLVDVSGGVSITEQRDSHGGTIVTITTDGEVTPIDSPTLVVTLSWDSNFGNNGGWVPNKTYAEISAAYTAGKDIVVDCDGGAYVEPLYITAEGVWVSEESSFLYCTHMFEDIQLEPGKWATGVIETWYVYQSSGLTEDSSSVYYNTADATISTSAQLPSGITAYGNGMRYVGTAANRSSADAVSDGPEIVFPAGYYASTHTGIVQGGTAGTPTATKGTVSNHSISITPSVTNTEGWISGGTKTGSAVTVSASELVSGSQTVANNGTVNVTNLASVTVAVPFVTYYTGSSNPSSSLGQNGDIYLKVVS